MPLKEDYVHDAVVYIWQTIDLLQENYVVDSEWHHTFNIAKSAIRESGISDPLCMNLLGISCVNEEHIPYLKLAIERLHESIGYNPTPNNPNQLTINFDGKQNPDNQN